MGNIPYVRETGYIIVICLLMVIASLYMTIMTLKYRRDLIPWMIGYYFHTIGNFLVLSGRLFLEETSSNLGIVFSGLAVLMLVYTSINQYSRVKKRQDISPLSIIPITFLAIIVSVEILIGMLLVISSVLLYRIYHIRKTPSHRFMLLSLYIAILNIIFTILAEYGIIYASEINRAMDIAFASFLLLLPLIITHEEELIQNQRKIDQTHAELRQSQKMESVGRLSGGIAHDFNNILTGIVGNVELCLMDLEEDNPAIEHLEEIQKMTTSAAYMTSQLLTFSRKKVVKPLVINPTEIIEDMGGLIARLIGENIKLKLDLAVDTPNIFMDRGLMQQVIMNLVVNARDAMPTGGDLSIFTALQKNPDRITPQINGEPISDFCQIRVKDSGCGMSSEVKSHLFEPFFTTKAPHKGTGLGLSVVYGAIQSANGKIEVFSEVGIGSEFLLSFPASGQGTKSKPHVKSDRHISHGTEKILYVEDNPIVGKTVSEMLLSLGYSVEKFIDGKSALQSYQKSRQNFDILITDIIMPDINGIQLAAEIKKFQPDICILFTSGFADGHLQGNNTSSLDGHFIQKPFSLAELSNKIRDTLAEE